MVVHKRMSIYNLQRFDYNLQKVFVTGIHLLVIINVMQILFRVRVK